MTHATTNIGRPHATLSGLVVLLCCAALPGCQHRFRTPEFWRPQTPTSGPSESPTTGPAESDAAPRVPINFEPRERIPLPETGGVRRLYVELSVLKIEAPVGRLAAARRVWELIDSNAVPVALLTAMRDNGFQIGVGRHGVRKEIADALGRIEGVQSRENQVLISATRPIDMLIRDTAQDETVFYVGRDGGMTGYSFEAGQPFFKIEVEVSPDVRKHVHLRVTPEIREPAGAERWENVEGEWMMRPEYRGRVFRDLTIEADVPPRGFLVIGPTRDAAQSPLIGRPFLVQQERDKTREFLYVINPIPRWAGASAAATVQGQP